MVSVRAGATSIARADGGEGTSTNAPSVATVATSLDGADWHSARDAFSEIGGGASASPLPSLPGSPNGGRRRGRRRRASGGERDGDGYGDEGSSYDEDDEYEDDDSDEEDDRY